MNMKLFFSLLLLLSVLFAKAQHNEFVFYAGIGVDDKINSTEVLQFRYNYQYSNLLSFQGGLRQQNQIESIIEKHYVFIDNAYLSRILDLTLFCTPLNFDRFKIGIGAGVGLGFSRYYITSKTVNLWESTGGGGYDTYVYGQHKYIQRYDPGLHAIIQGNYFIGNSLFFSGQVMFNRLIGNLEDEGLLISNESLNISIGIGFRF